MKKNVLVTQKNMEGKYVALKSYFDRTIIASGKDPLNVVKRVEKKGVKNSVLVYVPEKDTVHVY
ncbi:MAG: hypothetical protein HQK84_12410 [Nitrospinae bacterium]|nr:hypothetical protein [Nitrospinota bacterium]